MSIESSSSMFQPAQEGIPLPIDDTEIAAIYDNVYVPDIIDGHVDYFFQEAQQEAQGNDSYALQLYQLRRQFNEAVCWLVEHRTNLNKAKDDAYWLQAYTEAREEQLKEQFATEER